MMYNLADIIERWILEKLAGAENQIVILKRGEIAAVLECAPSQVSYVLNTRFTMSRGFLVESRRGLGGFVRIARIPVYEDAGGDLDDEMNLGKMKEILHRLRNNNLLTVREAALLERCADMICEHTAPNLRAKFFKSLLLSLNHQE